MKGEVSDEEVEEHGVAGASHQLVSVGLHKRVLNPLVLPIDDLQFNLSLTKEGYSLETQRKGEGK